MSEGLALYRGTGAEIALSATLAIQAGLVGRIQSSQEGLRIQEEALSIAQKNGELFWEAELHRCKGELLLQSGKAGKNQEEAETCFQQALETAQKQQAKSLELRAAMSLSRLWQDQGKTKAAYKLLSSVYDWFTEGFETAGLKEAKRLLGKLHGQSSKP